MSIALFLKRRQHPYTRYEGPRLVGSNLVSGDYETLRKEELKRRKMQEIQSDVLNAAIQLEAGKAAEEKAVQEEKEKAENLSFLDFTESIFDALSEKIIDLIGL
jgi:predicted nucleic acid-binding protein